VRSPGTGPTTPPAAPVASVSGAAHALWPAVVFGFAGLYLQARTKRLGRFAPHSRYCAAATLSTLTWCAVLGGSYVATSSVLRRATGRSGHGAGLSHAAGERVALLLLAAVIVGLAALVELPAQPSRRGANPPRT